MIVAVDGECIFCEDIDIVTDTRDWGTHSEVRFYYGDYCGFNYEFSNCQRCEESGGGASSLQSSEPDCAYGEQSKLLPNGWLEEDLCNFEEFHCLQPVAEFEAVAALVTVRDVVGLALLINESDGRIYYSQTAGAIQLLGCGNLIAGSYPVERKVADELQLELERIQ
jgi:hypothetical protein